MNEIELAREVGKRIRAATDSAVAELRAEIAAIPAGPQGERGEKGEPGERGPQGEKGMDGKDGSDGAAGERGEKGTDGKDGRDGRDGKDGRDGVATTDELKALVESEVERRLEGLVEKRVAEAFAALPVLQYRGVWQDGEEYAPGHTATWAGSLWHCNEATSDKPGENDAWTLAVKRGRDGKDWEPAGAE